MTDQRRMQLSDLTDENLVRRLVVGDTDLAKHGFLDFMLAHRIEHVQAEILRRISRQTRAVDCLRELLEMQPDLLHIRASKYSADWFSAHEKARKRASELLADIEKEPRETAAFLIFWINEQGRTCGIQGGDDFWSLGMGETEHSRIDKTDKSAKEIAHWIEEQIAWAIENDYTW